MLDVKKIIENPELIKARLAKKGHDVDFSALLELDAERKQIIVDKYAYVKKSSCGLFLTSTFLQLLRTGGSAKHFLCSFVSSNIS